MLGRIVSDPQRSVCTSAGCVEEACMHTWIARKAPRMPVRPASARLPSKADKHVMPAQQCYDGVKE